MQSLPLYTSCLFSILLNGYIVNIKNLMQYVCLLLLQMNFQDYFYIHQFFYYSFRTCINNKWCFIRFLIWLNSNILVSPEGIITLQKSLFSRTFLCHSTLFFGLEEWRQFRQSKSPLFFDVIPLNNADTFCTAR